MQLITIALKDSIIQRILIDRNVEGAFTIPLGSFAIEIGLSKELINLFMKELESSGYLSKYRVTAGTKTVYGITSAKLDTFYEQGGYTGIYSIKNLIESKLMYEVEQLLKQAEKDNKPDQIKRLKEIASIGKDIISIGKLFLVNPNNASQV